MGWNQELLLPSSQEAARHLTCCVCLEVLQNAVCCPEQHGVCLECKVSHTLEDTALAPDAMRPSYEAGKWGTDRKAR